MSTFTKLSLVAQYDDMCRLVNKYIKIKEDDEEHSIQLLESVQQRLKARELDHANEKDEMRREIEALQKQIKKLNRELVESRSALVRETEEKKVMMKDRDELKEQIRSVRKLLEDRSNDHRDHELMRYLDVKRLSPIPSDDSSDGQSGLEYDRTEESILAESRRSSRRQSNLNRNSRGTTTTTTSSSKNHDTDSPDESNIEFVRQQFKKLEEERLASAVSTPNLKEQHITKAMTLSAKSVANMMKCASTVGTPASTTQKPHSFINKRVFRPEYCGPCGLKIPFYGNSVKCENCGAVSHPECKDGCPLPCVKITAPLTRSRSKKILISDYVNSDATPKVPAIIVHCCNEIERADNILTEGLYRVVARASDIETLQQRILKSKSGMPNLSREDVHLLCGVVKRFLQSLDESLVTTTLWCHFSEAVKNETNRETLAFFMQHLHSIAKHSAQNKMTIKNLARTLAPTVIGNSCRNPSPSIIQQENKIQISIMETIFEIEEDFWSNFIVKKATETPTLGSRLLGPSSPSKTRAGSRFGATLPTPKMKSLWS